MQEQVSLFCIAFPFPLIFTPFSLPLSGNTNASVSEDRGALTVAVEGRLVIPDPARRVSHQILSLNGDEFFATSREDGSFTFHHIPSGESANFVCVLDGRV